MNKTTITTLFTGGTQNTGIYGKFVIEAKMTKQQALKPKVEAVVLQPTVKPVVSLNPGKRLAAFFKGMIGYEEAIQSTFGNDKRNYEKRRKLTEEEVTRLHEARKELLLIQADA